MDWSGTNSAARFSSGQDFDLWFCRRTHLRGLRRKAQLHRFEKAYCNNASWSVSRNPKSLVDDVRSLYIGAQLWFSVEADILVPALLFNIRHNQRLAPRRLHCSFLEPMERRQGRGGQ